MLPDSENRNQKYNPNQTFNDGQMKHSWVKFLRINFRTSTGYTSLDSRIRENDGEWIDQEMLKLSEKWLKLEIFDAVLTDWYFRVFTPRFKIFEFFTYTKPVTLHVQ